MARMQTNLSKPLQRRELKAICICPLPEVLNFQVNVAHDTNGGDVGVNCTRRMRLLPMTLVVASIAVACQRGAASPIMGVENMTSLC